MAVVLFVGGVRVCAADGWSAGAGAALLGQRPRRWLSRPGRLRRWGLVEVVAAALSCGWSSSRWSGRVVRAIRSWHWHSFVGPFGWRWRPAVGVAAVTAGFHTAVLVVALVPGRAAVLVVSTAGVVGVIGAVGVLVAEVVGGVDILLCWVLGMHGFDMARGITGFGGSTMHVGTCLCLFVGLAVALWSGSRAFNIVPRSFV